VTEADEVLHAVAQGNARRVSAGRTPQGRRVPSRAHAIFTLNLMQRSGPHITTSKLQFVDLAGADSSSRSAGLKRICHRTLNPALQPTSPRLQLLCLEAAAPPRPSQRALQVSAPGLE
jgi:hypothetical protein